VTSQPPHLDGGEFALQVRDQSFERRLPAQARKMGIHAEEGPAGEPGVNGAFQPPQGLIRVPEYGIDTGNLIVGVVIMTEGTRGIERSTHTLRREVGLVAPGVQQALQAHNQRLVGQLSQSRRQPLLGEIQVSGRSLTTVANASSARAKSPLYT